MCSRMIRSMMWVVFLCAFIFTGTSGAFASTLKKTIAVANFENKTSYSGQVNLDIGMADQLTDALMQSGKFVVLEREILSDVMAEQDLAASNRAAASKNARTGKIMPAQILIKGAITEFEAENSSSGTGIGYAGFSIGSSKASAHVGLIIRIIDTTSGQVLDSVRVEGEAQAGGLSFGVDRGVSFGTEGFKATPLGKAVQMAIDRAVIKICARLEDVPYSGRIIKVDGNTIFVNIGQRSGAKVDDTFDAYSLGEEMTDPDTGEILGSEKTKIGSLKITSVEEKFSKAIATSGSGFTADCIVTQ